MSHAQQFGGSVLTEAQYALSCRIERVAEQGITAGNMSSVDFLDQVAEVVAEVPNRKAQGEDFVPNENSEGWWTACVLTIGPVVFQGK